MASLSAAYMMATRFTEDVKAADKVSDTSYAQPRGVAMLSLRS
jgi:hypothetical protein